MRIGVLGTGVVGRTIAGKLAGLRHGVVVGTREPAATRERTEPDRFGTAPATWLAKHPELHLGTFAEAAVQGELVVNATSGLASLDLTTARGTALLLPTWLSLIGALAISRSSFQFKVVR